MDRPRGWTERLRRAARVGSIGRDDRQGVAADPVPAAAAGQPGQPGQPGPARQPGPTGLARQPGPPGQPGFADRLGLPPAILTLAAWSLALLVVGAFGAQLLVLLAFFSEVTVPLAISLLTTALASPVVDWLVRVGIGRKLAALLVVLAGLVVFGSLLALIGTQVAGQFTALREDVAAGLGQVQDWLQDGPLGLSRTQLDDLVDRGRAALENADVEVIRRAAAVGTTLGALLAGFFIIVFATFFFCADGGRIWRWVVLLLPRAARAQVDSSGRVAWVSLTAFVRATVLVALTDAAGIGLAAVLLGIPLALPLAVLVFVGAFVPIIGALVSGAVAVLVALVAQGPVVALVMLGAVVVVQQLESHVLQPFLMGRFVSVHPLGIILAIAAGLVAGGVVGALIAVPLVACANAVGKHLAGRDAAHDPAPAPGALTPAAAPD